MNLVDKIKRILGRKAEIRRLESIVVFLARESVAAAVALQAIIDRSNNGERGTSKVADMRDIAVRAIEVRSHDR